MVIRIYWASVTGNRKINSDQTRLRYIIESLKITSEWIDITTDPLVRQKMREECGNPKAMPPQIFNEFRYLGEVSDMEEYVEEERPLEWFGLDESKRDDVINNDAIHDDTTCHDVKNLTNGISETKITEEVVTNGVTSVDGRLQNSPTSSVENEPPVQASMAPSTECVNRTATATKDEEKVDPPRKNVLAAAGAFEALSKEPQTFKSTRKVTFTHSRSLNANDNNNNTKKPVDDERRRRILGLSISENSPANDAIASQCNSDSANIASIAS